MGVQISCQLTSCDDARDDELSQIVVTEDLRRTQGVVQPSVAANHARNQRSCNSEGHAGTCDLLLLLNDGVPVDKVQQLRRYIDLARHGVSLPLEHDVGAENQVLVVIAQVHDTELLNGIDAANSLGFGVLFAVGDGLLDVGHHGILQFFGVVEGAEQAPVRNTVVVVPRMFNSRVERQPRVVVDGLACVLGDFLNLVANLGLCLPAGLQLRLELSEFVGNTVQLRLGDLGVDVRQHIDIVQNVQQVRLRRCQLRPGTLL